MPNTSLQGPSLANAINNAVPNTPPTAASASNATSPPPMESATPSPVGSDSIKRDDFTPERAQTYKENQALLTEAKGDISYVNPKSGTLLTQTDREIAATNATGDKLVLDRKAQNFYYISHDGSEIAARADGRFFERADGLVVGSEANGDIRARRGNGPVSVFTQGSGDANAWLTTQGLSPKHAATFLVVRSQGMGMLPEIHENFDITDADVLNGEELRDYRATQQKPGTGANTSAMGAIGLPSTPTAPTPTAAPAA